MAKTKTTTASCLALFSIAVVQSGESVAANWTITPSLALSETYTDNISLAPDDEKTHDFVTLINPGLSVRGEGDRLKLALDYSLQEFLYARSEEGSRTFHQLDSSINSELVQDWFFVDGGVARTQQAISPAGAIPLDNFSLTGNRANVTTYSISPYVRHKFGNFATGRLVYRYDRVTDDRDILDNAENQQILVGAESEESFDRLGWRADYTHQKFDGTHRLGVTIDRTNLELRYKATGSVTLLGIGGYENYNYDQAVPVDGDGGSYWSVGAEWQATTRTLLRVTGGRRFFGNTASVLLRHQMHRTALELSYIEDVVTFPETLTTRLIYEPTGDVINPVLVNPVLTQEAYLSKRFVTTVSGKTAKTSYSLGIFDENRDYQVSGMHEDVVGGDALWSWQFAPRTEFHVKGGGRNRDVDGTDNIWYAGTGVVYKLSRNADTTLEYQHADRNAEGTSVDYTQNVISATVKFVF